MKPSRVELLLLFVLSPCYTWAAASDVARDIVVEYEGTSVCGLKLFLLPCDSTTQAPECLDIEGRAKVPRFGFFVGGKVSTNRVGGTQYNWSQARAEEYYGSEFVGYSDKELYGLNGGITHSLWRDRCYLYGGLGFVYSTQYRQYYDDTFSVWSNSYYIEDGMKEDIALDLIFGGNVRIGRLVLGLGYSTALSNVTIAAGIRF